MDAVPHFDKNPAILCQGMPFLLQNELRPPWCFNSTLQLPIKHSHSDERNS